MVATKSLLRRGLIAALVFVLGATHRVTRINWHVLESLERRGEPFLVCLWHNSILSAIYHLRPHTYPAVISRSRDGEDITWVVERFGYGGLRGSTTVGGSGVLRQALRVLGRRRPVIVTPDGPRGPRFVLKSGIVALARRTGAPIVPLCFSARRRWEFHSWDRMMLPKPFARVAAVAGDPIRLDPDAADEETHRVQVEAAMHRLVSVAEAYTGADALFPPHDPAAPVAEAEAGEDPEDGERADVL